ncbi:hypothetical protein GWK47_013403 [Chionoecetes opilio]|uniref:Uncharacterized protein n=1 Tax=Chionoecetes opilio TaxID=41210 RepID=A0A8J5CL92_CHIOP|nr:hypothetical protein GWK47_013403 [Chionoecetes opilio]
MASSGHVLKGRQAARTGCLLRVQPKRMTINHMIKLLPCTHTPCFLLPAALHTHTLLPPPSCPAHTHNLPARWRGLDYLSSQNIQTAPLASAEIGLDVAAGEDSSTITTGNMHTVHYIISIGQTSNFSPPIATPLLDFLILTMSSSKYRLNNELENQNTDRP